MRFIYSCISACWGVEANNGNNEWMNEEPAQLKSVRWERGEGWRRAKGHDSMSAIEATTTTTTAACELERNNKLTLLWGT